MGAGQETRGSSFDNSSVYDTTEFHLYCRKIIACSKRYSHEWTTCPFAHPGEKAKRRDPRTHQYDCEMCPTVVKGEVCELGAACPHSHHVFESWLHPQKFRTMICKDGEACHREVCFFAHGAEQLRTPTGGPSKLRRQSSSQEEAARQAGAAAAAAVAAGGSGSFGGMQNPQAAAASAAAAAAQFNAMAGSAGAGSSSSRHVWVQGLQQQQQGAVAVMPYVDAGASASSSMGKNKAAAGSGVSNGYGTVMSSSSNAVQPNGDSRRSSLCESSTSSSMMIAPSSMQLSGNNAFSGSAHNSAELGRPMIGVSAGMPAAAGSGNSNAGLSDLLSMRMLVSSLMTEIQNTRQEAMDSRNAAMQAQQQLKAITEALGTAGGPGIPADAAAAQAAQLLGGSASVAAAARDQLQQQQQAMMQRAASGMPAFPEAMAMDAAAAAGLSAQLAGAGLSHTISDGSNMSCSGNWASAVAADMMARLPAASAAPAASTAPDAAVASLAQRLSLEQAAAAGSGSNLGLLSGQPNGQLRGYVVRGSYPVAAGGVSCSDGADAGAGSAAGVMNWLPLLPPAQGLDAVAPLADLSGMAGGVGASSAAGVSAAGSWRNSFEAAAPVFNLAPAAAAAAVSQNMMTSGNNAPVTMALPLSGNNMQQQQSTADYLLQVQQQHGMLPPPELAFMMSGGVQQPGNMQQLQEAMMQQQQVVRSAPVMLQGWAGAGRVGGVEDGVQSGGNQEVVMSPSVEVPAGYTTAGGNRQLGWL